MTIKDIKKSLVVFLTIFGFFSGAKVSATSYSYDVDVQFNFNSKLAVTITDADIKILDLAPGTSADSNIVGITISTNNVAGYTAEATVGNAQNATTNMTHTNGANTFASIATNASQASLTTDNTWGYAVSTDNGTSWSNFSGLPVYTEDGKQLASTDSPASDAIQFKINAKAATSQPAGDYTNVINFKVVANVPPREWEDIITPDYCTTHPTECDDVTGRVTMQSMDENICGLVEEVDSEFQFTDARDHKNYWVAKLRDGKCWMTQNLDFDIDYTKTYTNEDTDIGFNGLTYSQASWKPYTGTIPPERVNENGNITGWIGNGYIPDSVDVGDWYYTGTWVASGSAQYKDWETSPMFSKTPFESNGTHGHVGNYYNWPAAVAQNNTNSQTYRSYSDDLYNPTVNPQTSVCPTGWRLPVISLYTEGSDDDNDYYNLIRRYQNTLTTDNGIVGVAPLWYTRIGYAAYGSVANNAGWAGYYWSSTMNGDSYSFNMRFESSAVVVASLNESWSRSTGFPIRCVSRDQDKLTIIFNANGGTGSASSQRIDYGSRTPLKANTFTRPGYIFNGWNTDPNGKGDGYAGGGVYRAPSNTLSNTHVTLYAQWLPDSSGSMEGGVTIAQAYEFAYTEHGKTAYKGHFKMQDIDLTYNGTKVCDLVTVIGDKYPAIDERDNTIYEITKSPDGRCWMMQNLQLDLLDSGTRSAMNSTNTNATNAEIGYLLNGGGTTSDQYATSAVANWTSGQSYSDPLMNATSKDLTRASFSNPYDKFIPANNYKFGIYYNYCAASAGSYCYGDGNTDSGSSIDIPDTAVDSEHDICPAGWRLPTGLSGGEQISMYNSYNGATQSSYALYNDYGAPGSQYLAARMNQTIPMSGYISSGSATSQATTSYYWSSTRVDDQRMDSLNVYSSGAQTSIYMRNYGLTIRCIAK